MNLNVLNPYAMKTLIAARKEDSIRAISGRIGLSYGWTYKWVLELERTGVFKRSGKKVFLNEKNRFYKEALGFIRTAFGKDVGFRYSALSLFGIKYCFTGTDAVLIWTDGGYNIARYRDYYPLFIKVRESDRKAYEFCVRKIGSKGKVFYEPTFLDDFPVSMHDGMPVDRLEETIMFMKKHIYNFQPALEMIGKAHGIKTGVKYAEAVRNA